jgi:hypothetical protein
MTDKCQSIAGMIMACALGAGAADFGGWQQRTEITFNGYGKAETLTNFPALVRLGTNVGGFAYSQFASTNGFDLRFADSTQTNELNYEVERWNTGGISYVWVQIPGSGRIGRTRGRSLRLLLTRPTGRHGTPVSPASGI